MYKQKSSWSLAELNYLMENYQNFTIEELAIDLSKTTEEIITMARRAQITINRKTNGAKLTETRLIKLCSNPLCKGYFIISEYEQNRRKNAGRFCSNECSAISRKIMVPKKEELILDYRSSMSTNDIAKKYKISKGTVYNLFKFYEIETRTLSDSISEFFKTEKGVSAIKDRLKTIQKKYGTTCLGGGQAGFGKLKSGYKEDLKLSVRSGWEGNVLRWLNHLNRTWEYEPKVFYFEEIKHGTMAYTPDIYLPKEDVWIEVKGFLRKEDQTKIRRFKKYYPKDFKKLRVIIKNNRIKANDFFSSLNIPIEIYYDDLSKQYSKTIPNWE